MQVAQFAMVQRAYAALQNHVEACLTLIARHRLKLNLVPDPVDATKAAPAIDANQVSRRRLRRSAKAGEVPTRVVLTKQSGARVHEKWRPHPCAAAVAP